MGEFIVTPTNVDLLENIFRNSITGKWTIPILTFNTNFTNPYYQNLDPLNNNKEYQKSVISYFYLKLTEKWLFKEPIFRSLLKYFRVEKNGTTGKIYLISDKKNISNEFNTKDTDSSDDKYIFKYIEKYFISKHFVKKILKEYINKTNTKWYDLFNNSETLKELFAHKLKKKIISTISQLDPSLKK